MGFLGRLMGKAEGTAKRGTRGGRAKTTGRPVRGKGSEVRATSAGGRRTGRGRATPPPSGRIGRMMGNLLHRH
jgi:hypothetical protein